MWTPLIIFVVLWLLILCKENYRWIYMVVKTLPRDIRVTILYYKIIKIAKAVNQNKQTLSVAFSIVAKKEPKNIAFYYKEEKWSYEMVEKFSHKITRYFTNQGYAKGDTIAFLMENCLEYPCVFLGLSRIGVITALINTNLVNDFLANSITEVKPKCVIFGTTHKKLIEDIVFKLPGIKLYDLNRCPNEEKVSKNSIDLRAVLEKTSGKPITESHYDVGPTDPLLYIYTSGTTGFPKASVLTHLRYILGAKTFALICAIKQDDVLYNPLPFYHTAGGVLGLGQALVTGIPVVLRKKFSATAYFLDCINYNVTIAQYIGEMCRYILASSSQEAVQKHNVRVMVGNGLRPQIWKSFIDKFNIKQILEVYGATEGVSNFANLDNKVGSIGYIPWFLKKWFHIKLLKCDKSGQLLRNSDGRYMECDVGEPGVIVGKIDPKEEVYRFDGYTDTNATDQKILHDVFKAGDMYFNSGDILVYDEMGYFYFKDRTGDTFRWKGENVSTSEVEAIISNLVQLNDVVVYGVEVPNAEGKAGMAAIVDFNGNVNVEKLGFSLKTNLPKYAIPLFIRILDHISLTGTYKLKKVELRNEGYDLEKIKDKIYFFDSSIGTYVHFTPNLYNSIKNEIVQL